WAAPLVPRRRLTDLPHRAEKPRSTRVSSVNRAIANLRRSRGNGLAGLDGRDARACPGPPTALGAEKVVRLPHWLSPSRRPVQDHPEPSLLHLYRDDDVS